MLALRLLLRRRRLLVLLALPHQAGSRPHTCADRSTLAGVTSDGASDRPQRGTSRRPTDGAPLLWRRGGRRRLGLRGVNARLLLRPLMALELVVFELVLALPALRVDKDLSLSWSKGQCFQCAPSVAG